MTKLRYFLWTHQIICVFQIVSRVPNIHAQRLLECLPLQVFYQKYIKTIFSFIGKYIDHIRPWDWILFVSNHITEVYGENKMALLRVKFEECN